MHALRWLRNFKNPKGQVARWLERLSELDFSVEHRAGKQHGDADGMLRIPRSELDDEGRAERLNEESSVGRVNHLIKQTWECTLPDMKSGQEGDPSLRKALSWISMRKRPPGKEIADSGPTIGSLWSQFNRLKNIGGLLYREYESEDGKSKILQLILPSTMTGQILKALYDLPSAGHLGVNKMTDKVRQR